jgi:hypothetical protein
MAICSNCGAEGPRVRSRWNDKEQLPDICPSCSPSSFEKFTAPSEKKIWMGYEAHPNEYVKAEDGGFDRKPEYRVEQEEKLTQETAEERDARIKAEDNKRKTRRTLPMDEAELSGALRKAEEIVSWMTGTNVN